MKIKSIRLTAAAILLALLTSCSSAPPETPDYVTYDDGGHEIYVTKSDTELSGQMFAMDTFMTVSVRDGDVTADELRQCMEKIFELEDLLSVTLEGSDISKVNASGGAVEVSNETSSLISSALGYCRDTDGALDITAYPLVRAWGFTTGDYRIPDDTEIKDLLGSVGYDKVSIDRSGVTTPADTLIDLGAVAKGYAGDVLSSSLIDAGATSALISLGGNIVCIGTKPDSSKWRVAVRDPENAAKNIGYVDVSDVSVITSGGYERYFEGDDGEIYWHIIDPSTGYPAKNGIISATVITADGMKGDALSTALFVMGEARAAEYYRSHSGFEAILVTDDGRVLITEGLDGIYVPLENSRTVEILK